MFISQNVSESQPSSKVAEKVEDKKQELAQDGDFWSGWLGSGGKKPREEDTATAVSAASHSSWNLPWGVKSPEETHEASSWKTASSEARSPKAGLQELDHLQTANDTGPHSSFSHAGTRSVQTAEAKPELFPPETSSVPLDASVHDTHTEKENLLASDSFTTDWQDFPLDSDVPEPEVSYYEEPESDKIRPVPDRKHPAKLHGSAISDKTVAQLENFSSVVAQGGDIDQADEKANRSIFDGHVSVPSADISLLPQKNSTQNAASDWSMQKIIDIDSTKEHTHLQELSPVSQVNLSLKDNFPFHSNEVNVKQDDGSLKISSSGSFTAVSVDGATETMSSLSSAFTQESVMPVGETHADVPESTEVPLSGPGYASDLFFKSQVEEESLLPSSGTEVSELDVCEVSAGKTGVNPQESAEVSLPELILSSDYQKSQSDFIQEYVNISSASNDGQGVTLESSVLLPEDLLHSSTDPEMGASRTSSDLDLPGGGRASSTGSSDTSKFDSSIDTIVDRSVLDSQSDVDLMEKDHQYSLFGDSSGGGSELGAGGMNESGLLDDSSQSLSSSYVKCMIEEAMEDSNKIEDSGSDNHSSGEKSESSKVDSELEKSVYSGHESSDEIETTTSSDIEIISAPTPNGDSKYHTPYDLSPLKISLQRTGRDQGHHRSDSQSSSSAHSKAGEADRLSPERGDGVSWRDDGKFQLMLSVHSEISVN